MQKLGDIANAVQGKIHVQRKAPVTVRTADRDAAVLGMSPLIVASKRLFQFPDVFTDGNAVIVYLALASHANKAGMTACGQSRLATITGLSLRTIARKLDKLKAAGLIRKEYQRPVKGNPYKRLNIMRIIYDNGDMTRQDAQAIAGHPKQRTIGQQDGRQSQPDNLTAELSTGNPPTIGQHESHIVGTICQPDNATICQTDDLHICQNNVADNQCKHINNKDTSAEQEYTHSDVITYWRTIARHKAQEVMPNEADHAIIEQLMQAGVPLQRIKGAIADHCLDAQEAGRPPAVRLKPAVAELLATR